MSRFLFLSFLYVLALNVLFAALVLTGFGMALFAEFLAHPAAVLLYPLLRLAPFALVRKDAGPARERTYYLVCLFFDALLVLLGLAAVVQGNISAARGGGLLGGFGYLVIAAAVAFHLLTLIGLRLLRFFKKRPPPSASPDFENKTK